MELGPRVVTLTRGVVNAWVLDNVIKDSGLDPIRAADFIRSESRGCDNRSKPIVRIDPQLRRARQPTVVPEIPNFVDLRVDSSEVKLCRPRRPDRVSTDGKELWHHLSIAPSPLSGAARTLEADRGTGVNPPCLVVFRS